MEQVTQKISAFDFLYLMMNKANKNDFKGYELSESAGIQSAFEAIGKALQEGQDAVNQLAQSKDTVKAVPALENLELLDKQDFKANIEETLTDVGPEGPSEEVSQDNAPLSDE